MNSADRNDSILSDSKICARSDQQLGFWYFRHIGMYEETFESGISQEDFIKQSRFAVEALALSSVGWFCHGLMSNPCLMDHKFIIFP